jgi:hypothetical protein
MYSGSVAARNCIHDHELWLQPNSMDSKGAAPTAAARRQLQTRVSPRGGL